MFPLIFEADPVSVSREPAKPSDLVGGMHEIHFVVFGIHPGNGRAGDFSEQFPEGTVIVPLIPRERKTGPICR